MKRHIVPIICCCLILWCITGLVATPVFATVQIESVVCNPNTGRLTVKYKNQAPGSRAGVIYSEVYNKNTGKWDVSQQQYIDPKGNEEVTRELDSPPGAVVRRVRIEDQGEDVPKFESDTCNDSGDSRWSYVGIPTLTQWSLIIMAGLLLTAGVVVIKWRRKIRLA